MRYHEDGEIERLLQGADQIIEITGRDWIQSRGGLVQEDEFGIECERPRECHALGHSARKLRRQLVAIARLETDHRQLGQSNLAKQALRKG